MGIVGQMNLVGKKVLAELRQVNVHKKIREQETSTRILESRPRVQARAAQNSALRGYCN